MGQVLVVEGERKLEGVVKVSGAKNAALPLLIASLLTADECVLSNVPDLADIQAMLELLDALGAEHRFFENQVVLQTPQILRADAPSALVRSLRASFWILAPLLARHGIARVSLPGGDSIGGRPVDLHLSGLAKMGAQIKVENGVVFGFAPGGLHPAAITLDYPSVGATHQLLMAASAVEGVSVIENAACEPEVVALATFLGEMGADISGAGTSSITISGKRKLHGAKMVVLGDRIEAATYLLAGAITGGHVCVEGLAGCHLQSTLEVLEQMGCRVEIHDHAIGLQGPARLKPVTIATAPFPGVATDVQPLLMAALTKAEGISRIAETVFESRFGHACEYRKFGADISLQDDTAIILGKESLAGARADAGDIRAAAGLVLLGLMAEGITTITNVHHLIRGYEGMDKKLRLLGASINFVDEYGSRELVVGC